MRQGIFAAIACVALAGCAVSSESSDEGASSQSEAAASASSCRYKCTKCRPGMACIQMCETFGNCPSTCTSIALCVEGYVWDDKACACVRSSAPAGDACGPTTCAAGQICCNSSCGTCVEPGGVCTQQFCESIPVQ